MSVHPTADVSDTAQIAETASVWHLAQIRGGAVIADGVSVGRGAYVGLGVRIGRNSKIQNFALVYEPAELGEGAFIGPGAVLTNDLRPRSINPDGSRKSGDDWHAVGVTVLDGASVGARAVCVAPLTIGRWAMVAAGAVVTKDVPDFALVVGVPARHAGWVGRTGTQLLADADDASLLRCPDTGAEYILETSGLLVERLQS